MKSPILGSSYVAKSRNAAYNRMINLYLEVVPDEEGKEVAFLTRCPGLNLRETSGLGKIRGEHKVGSILYVVSGYELYKIDTSWNATLIGAVTGEGQVSMADNGTQLFIACNPKGFIYNTSTSVLVEITDPDFPGSVTVAYVDGYFVFNEPDSQKMWITLILDGTQIDALEFTSVDYSPDLLRAIWVNRREVWAFGESTVQVFYNAATVDFPFQAIPGAFIELGTVATFSVAKLDNTLFWLGQDLQGHGIVYRSSGYNAVRVSTHAIEWQIQSYGTISDAIGFAFQQNGHQFYRLTFPTADKTWEYDLTTKTWHECAGFYNGDFTRHRANCCVFFNNANVVGDFENGNIYTLDDDVYEDNGVPQKWLRTWRALPTGKNNLKRTAHHSLQLDCETGVGLQTGQGSDPEVDLRWSDDGGHTWSNIHTRTMGAVGEYGHRVIWRRLGMTEKIRDRVYEVSGTDPVEVTILGAELMISGTNS